MNNMIVLNKNTVDFGVLTIYDVKNGTFFTTKDDDLCLKISDDEIFNFDKMKSLYIGNKKKYTNMPIEIKDVTMKIVNKESKLVPMRSGNSKLMIDEKVDERIKFTELGVNEFFYFTSSSDDMYGLSLKLSKNKIYSFNLNSLCEPPESYYTSVFDAVLTVSNFVKRGDDDEDRS